jgi:hypothetical protein
MPIAAAAKKGLSERSLGSGPQTRAQRGSLRVGMIAYSFYDWTSKQHEYLDPVDGIVASQASR